MTRHGVPALLSLFFPGLGQLVKGQWEYAVLVWIAIGIPWGILVVIAGYAGTGYATLVHAFLYVGLDEVIPNMLKSPFLPFVLLLNLIVQLWAVVDAYRRPV